MDQHAPETMGGELNQRYESTGQWWFNLSEPDGWWAEAYAPEVDWALGDGLEHGDDPAWDVVEAEALYDLLEREVIPEFYARDESDIPTAWISRMRESMAVATALFLCFSEQANPSDSRSMC